MDAFSGGVEYLIRNIGFIFDILYFEVMISSILCVCEHVNTVVCRMDFVCDVQATVQCTVQCDSSLLLLATCYTFLGE